jgi:hypothetical protein
MTPHSNFYLLTETETDLSGWVVAIQKGKN